MRNDRGLDDSSVVPAKSATRGSRAGQEACPTRTRLKDPQRLGRKFHLPIFIIFPAGELFVGDGDEDAEGEFEQYGMGALGSADERNRHGIGRLRGAGVKD